MPCYSLTEATAAWSVLQVFIELISVLPVCRVGHCPGRQVQVYVQLTPQLTFAFQACISNARLLSSQHALL